MRQQPKHLYEFGPFQLDVVERQLRRNLEIIPLPPKAFDLLLVLIERPGHLWEKGDLMQEVWPDSFVEETNLSYSISLIRKALGEGENGLKYIETVPKHGYRFTAEVRITGAEPDQQDEEATEAAVPRRRVTLSPRWFLVASAMLLLLALAVYFYWSKQATDPVAVLPKIKSVAVLPGKPVTADSHDETLEMGLALALITKLSGLRRLEVRPLGAVFKYKHLEQDPLAAGREQQVDAVLESYLQRIGDKVRISALLRNVADGSTLWKDEFTESHSTDIFQLQDVIAEKVAVALISELTADERKQLRKRYTENRAASDLYAQGRLNVEKRTSESFQLAERYFRQALDLDPNYALAHVGLSELYHLGMGSHLQPGNPRALEEARKALALDDTISEAHTALARILWQQEWNWTAAENELKLALELDPNNAFAHRIYGHYLQSMRRHDEALTHRKLALEFDPRSLIINLELGQTLYYVGQINESLAQYRKTQVMDPTFVETYHRIGEWYHWQGRYVEAIVELGKALPLSERHAASTLLRLGISYAKLGKRDEAMKRLEQVKEIAKRNRVSSYEMAWFYAELGDKNQAFEWLRQGCNERDRYMVLLKSYPTLTSLYNDPRFAEMVRCVGLPQ